MKIPKLYIISIFLTPIPLHNHQYHLHRRVLSWQPGGNHPLFKLYWSDNSTLKVEANTSIAFNYFCAMSWNILGLFRNFFNLKHFINIYSPDMIFISEPQAYQCDVVKAMQHLQGHYKYFLNSDDLRDPELPLVKSKAHGGTMALWKENLDPYISVHQVSSSSFLPIVFSPPDSIPSIHISVYLPTHGQDARFVDELAALMVCLDELRELYIEAPVFLRGDFNVNDRNVKRVNPLNTFCNDLNLVHVPINHSTYHHFTGNRNSDSNLHKLLFANSKASMSLSKPSTVNLKPH